MAKSRISDENQITLSWENEIIISQPEEQEKQQKQEDQIEK